MAYSYDDFITAANESGLMDQFSSYDLDLAQKYPEFGMSILSLKKDYSTANTDEQRLLLREAGNQLRSSYGNYTSNADGSSYVSDGKLPSEISDTIDKIGGYGSFSYDQTAPTYTNQYATQQQSLMDSLLNREDFSYNKENDPQWGSFKKSYLREGDRATSNALAQTSAASGGRASSFAVNAATQAGDYYATKLNDTLPTLYQQAYDRYLNEYQMKQSDLSALNTQEQFDYQKYLNDLSQYNTDRSFAYSNYLSEYDMLNKYLQQTQGQDATDYSRYLDSVTRRTDEERYQQQLVQQALENAMQIYQTYGYVPDNLADIIGLDAGTPTANQRLSDQTLQQQLVQQALENAMQIYQTYGYVPDNLADIIGLDAGTPTADQKYNDWYIQQNTKPVYSYSGSGGSSVKKDNGNKGGDPVVDQALQDAINRKGSPWTSGYLNLISQGNK